MSSIDVAVDFGGKPTGRRADRGLDQQDVTKVVQRLLQEDASKRERKDATRPQVDTTTSTATNAPEGADVPPAEYAVISYSPPLPLNQGTTGTGTRTFVIAATMTQGWKGGARSTFPTQLPPGGNPNPWDEFTGNFSTLVPHISD